MDRSTIYLGGCHCGKIRYRVEVEKLEAVQCNCSICSKKGFIHLIVPADRFTLLQGEADLPNTIFAAIAEFIPFTDLDRTPTAMMLISAA
jgi:hypothetical protein